jgi:ribose transport system permease protein
VAFATAIERSRLTTRFSPKRLRAQQMFETNNYPGAISWVASPVWVLIVLANLAHYSMAHTRFFRQFYYLGSNPKAAHLSGMNVEGLQICSFVLMGLLAGLAGILYASRIATATSTVGVGAECRPLRRLS